MSDGRGGEKIEKEWRMSVPLQPQEAVGWEGGGVVRGTHSTSSCWFLWKTLPMCWKIAGVNR